MFTTSNMKDYNHRSVNIQQKKNPAFGENWLHSLQLWKLNRFFLLSIAGRIIFWPETLELIVRPTLKELVSESLKTLNTSKLFNNSGEIKDKLIY